MLQACDLYKSYEGPGEAVHALEGVSFQVDSGQFVAIQGPSGSGKTTLLLALGGLLAPSGGQVLVESQDPYALSPNARARLRAEKIGFVFQQYHLVPYLSVMDNVLVPSLARPAAEARKRAAELIGHFNLSHRMHHVPAQLSSGERQRVALARALLNRPKLLLADEPTGNLDTDNSEIVLAYLSEFACAGGAVLLVTHDAEAASHAQLTLQLSNGRLSGSSE